MNNIIQTIRHTARAATVLLLALLTAQTAWADTGNVADGVYYVDADGNVKNTATDGIEGNDTPIVLNGGGDTTLSADNWYVVNHDITYTGTITLSDHDVTIILCDGKTMNIGTASEPRNKNCINGAGDDRSLTIYGQSGQTGVMKAYGSAEGFSSVYVKNFTQYGGNVIINSANGKTFVLDGGNLTLSRGTLAITASGTGYTALKFDQNNNATIAGGTLTVISEQGYAIEGTVIFNGGNFTANGYYAGILGKVYLGWSNLSDSFTCNSFDDVIIAEGKTFYDDMGNSYTASTPNLKESISGKTLHPWGPGDWAETANNEYTIGSPFGWEVFCDALQDNDTWNRFSGKTVKLGADITISRMAGGQPFTGTFDGQNHKLTLAYGTADAPVDAQFVAPFVETARETSPVFRNLTIDGTIYDGYTGSEAHNVGGLIGHLFGDVTIEHCVSRVEIHAKGGAGGFVGLCEHSVSFTDCHSSAVITSPGGNNSGFVAWSRASGWNINFTGCLFDGKLLQQNGNGASNGGFIGWTGSNKTVTITNCLCAPAPLDDGETMASSNSATFARGWNATTTATNCYYTHTLGAAQGKQARTVTAGTDVTISAIALTGTATQYTVSGITAYSGGGLQRGETLYYGIDDVVSLTLSNTATGAPDGYQYGYTTNAGTLEGSTLTMPDQDVTVSVNTEVLTAIPWSGDGTWGSPYIIKYASQLDLLAYRVNGTHGETCQEDGYYNTYFQLDKDISYPHKADGEEGADTESNYEAIGGYYGGGNRYFRGHFDGNSKTISGIRIYKNGNDDADYYQGIFGQTYGADIHHLTLADARITGAGRTGGIVGENAGGTVTRCHVASDVAVCAVHSYAYYHGGIAGLNRGTIKQCTSAATLTTADATSTQYYGGIAGYNYGGTLSDNLAIGATVPATANNSYGAITGYTGNNIRSLKGNYYAACKVADTENATGVGCGYIGNDDDGYITADVTANKGAVSIHTLTLADGITTSTTATVTIGTTGYYAQGTAIALSNSGTPGNIPLGYQYGFTASAGTISGSTLTMPAADVTVSINTDVLTAIPWSGDGTEGSPYLIKYASQLDLLAYRVNGTHGETRRDDGYEGKFFQLAKDISYPHKADGEEGADTESNYEAIGGYYYDDDRSFRGHFDGNNKTISGIRIYKDGDGDAYCFQGIFGLTSSGADIHDLTLADARITGCQFTGGIVGYNDGGTVSGCHVAADVAVCAVQSYAWYHGGIVGINDGTIEQCTSAATLTIADANNSKYYGGIAGFNNRGTLHDNLAIGATVPAAKDNTIGAITGYNVGGILQRNYYAACKVADTENATGVGCGTIGNGNGGYITADVNNDNNPNGARAVFALTLADGITTTTAATVTHAGTGYYAQGTAIALSYSGTTGDVPDGYQYGFTASAGTISGSTLTMPDQDVTVSPALRSTHAAVPVSYLDAGGNTQTHDAIALDGTESELAAEWYFVGTDIAFDHTLDLSSDVHLILADGCTMNVTSDVYNYGIAVNGSLTIYGQTEGTGALNATSENDEGIHSESGTITISGGRVTATSENTDGIHSESGNITISGGRVTASGGGAGIFTYGGTITISGGMVTATGGTGIYNYGGTITISGGRVTATGDNDYGIYNDSGDITLGCTTASDFIYASSYRVVTGGTLNIADGQTLYDEDGNFYRGNGVTIPAGKTLRPGLTARQAPDGNYWTTYYNSDSGFTIDKNENACAYTATYGDGKLTLHNQGKEIPAGTAVIIVAENDVVSMTATGLGDFTGDNDLRGVNVDTPVADIRSDLVTGTFYVLGMTTVGNEQHFGFHRYTGSEMAAHKAYVLVSGSQQALARSLTMVFDDATGIESAEADSSLFTRHSSLSTWFTLDGRRLQAKPTAPGIYINNGKKVVIK